MEIEKKKPLEHQLHIEKQLHAFDNITKQRVKETNKNREFLEDTSIHQFNYHKNES